MGYIHNRRGNKNHGAICEYVKNKKMRSKFTFTIEPTGESYYNIGGDKVSAKDFDAMFPLGLIDTTRNGHLDGRTNFYD